MSLIILFLILSFISTSKSGWQTTWSHENLFDIHLISQLKSAFLTVQLYKGTKKLQHHKDRKFKETQNTKTTFLKISLRYFLCTFDLQRNFMFPFGQNKSAPLYCECTRSIFEEFCKGRYFFLIISNDFLWFAQLCCSNGHRRNNLHNFCDIRKLYFCNEQKPQFPLQTLGGGRSKMVFCFEEFPIFSPSLSTRRWI